MIRLLEIVTREARQGASPATAVGTLLGFLAGLLTLGTDLLIAGNLGFTAGVLVAMAALGALFAFVWLVLLSLVSGVAIWLRPSARRYFGPTLAVGGLVLSALLVHGLLFTSFRLVRDVASERGLVIGGSLVAAWALAMVLLARWQATRALTSVTGTIWRPTTGLLALVMATVGLIMTGVGASVATPAYETDSGFTAPVAVRSDASSPTVILISIDTLRADHLGSYGYSRGTSANLDRLATAGTRFERAWSHSPWTLPSHATMFTSLYPVSHGVRFVNNFRFFNDARSSRLGEGHVTLAELLNAGGFRTAAFASVSYLRPELGLMQGFEALDVDVARTAEVTVDLGLNWLAQEPTRPAFLFLHFFDVHNYRSPPGFAERYREGHAEIDVRLGDAMFNLYEFLPAATRRELIARYDGALTYVDAELGRFFDRLRETGRFDSSVIIVTSDHGEEFWDHGGTGHGFTLYEEQLRVPLIIKPPGYQRRATRVSAEPVGVIDILPTVLDYVGSIEAPQVEGLSLRPLIEGQARLGRQALFAESSYFFNSYSVLMGHQKLVANRVPPVELFRASLFLANLRSVYKYRKDEFFQLDRDPSESANVIDEMPATLDTFRSELRLHLQGARRGDHTRLDEETLEELKALGYIR